MRRLGKEFAPWPGTGDIPMDTDEGLALLGTPHGSGAAWLLADHRALIRKKVGSVVIFLERLYPEGQVYSLNLLWKLVDI